MNSKGKPVDFELEDLGVHNVGVDNGFKNDDEISKDYTKSGATPMSNLVNNNNKTDNNITIEKQTPNTADRLIEKSPKKQVENQVHEGGINEIKRSSELSKFSDSDIMVESENRERAVPYYTD